MRIDTVKGCSYVVTCTGACTVQVLRADASPITILEAAKAGQYVLWLPRMRWRCPMNMRW